MRVLFIPVIESLIIAVFLTVLAQFDFLTNSLYITLLEILGAWVLFSLLFISLSGNATRRRKLAKTLKYRGMTFLKVSVIISVLYAVWRVGIIELVLYIPLLYAIIYGLVIKLYLDFMRNVCISMYIR